MVKSTYSTKRELYEIGNAIMSKFQIAGIALILFSLVWGYHIDEFNSKILIRADGTIEITETIMMDFEDEYSPGLQREIPLKHSILGSNRKYKISIVSITDERGDEIPYSIREESNAIVIKAGVENEYVSGIQTYTVSYTVSHVVAFFESYDEIFLDITGHEWGCRIEFAEARVILPDDLKYDAVTALCYSGRYSSVYANCQWTTASDGIYFSIIEPLEAGEGLSIILRIPKDVVLHPAAIEKLLHFITRNWHRFILLPAPIVLLAILLTIIFGNRRKAKYAESFDIETQYELIGELTPAEIGLIMDGHIDISDIETTLIDLAERGFITIAEKRSKKPVLLSNTDYAIILMKQIDIKNTGLKEYEKKLLNALFVLGDNNGKSPSDFGIPNGKKLIFVSTLKNCFYPKLDEILKSLSCEPIRNGYFTAHPYRILRRYRRIGMALVLTGIIIPSLLYIFTDTFCPPIISAMWAMLSSGIIFLILAPMMPFRTRKGVDMEIGIENLKRFIIDVDRYFYNKPVKKYPRAFKKILPYAIALDCVDIWTQRFPNIAKMKLPEWFIPTRPIKKMSSILPHLFTAMDIIEDAMISRIRGIDNFE